MSNFKEPKIKHPTPKRVNIIEKNEDFCKLIVKRMKQNYFIF